VNEGKSVLEEEALSLLAPTSTSSFQTMDVVTCCPNSHLIF
jgi:hypothetical protein